MACVKCTTIHKLEKCFKRLKILQLTITQWNGHNQFDHPLPYTITPFTIYSQIHQYCDGFKINKVPVQPQIYNTLVYMILNGKGSSKWWWSIYIYIYMSTVSFLFVHFPFCSRKITNEGKDYNVCDKHTQQTDRKYLVLLFLSWFHRDQPLPVHLVL